MKLDLMPLVSVQRAFARWKQIRNDLQKIRKRIESQDAILTPTEAMLPSEKFSQYQRIVVGAYGREFCRQILFSKARHGDSTFYEVNACWDAEARGPIDKIIPHQCNVLWDKVVIVPNLGFAPCLILSKVSRLSVDLCPIPIDSVEKVEAWATGIGR